MLRKTMLTSLTIALSAAAAPAALAGSTGTTNPCKLVTPADAKAALGVAAGTPKLLAAGLYQSCTYRTTAGTLTVLTRRLGRSDFVKSAKANPGPVAPVAGIGSSAYSVGGGSSLLVWRNGTEAAFSIFGAGKKLQAEEQLARRVVARL